MPQPCVWGMAPCAAVDPPVSTGGLLGWGRGEFLVGLAASGVFGRSNCRGCLFNLASRERERADRRQSWCR